MATIYAKKKKKKKSKNSPYIPPPISLPPSPTKFENLDRRIANLEALDPGFTPGAVLASYLALPGLVGFWPMSSVQKSTGNVYDLSGQDRTLSYNGNPVYTYHNGLVAYVDMDGTGDFLSRNTENDLNVLGTESVFTSGGSRGLTVGGWYWTDISSEQGLIGKYNTTGNQRSYLVTMSTAVTGYISNDGTTLTTVSGSTVTTGGWYFVVMRYIPSTSLDVFVNSVKSSNTTSIPAAIFESTASFIIGAFSAGTAGLLDGRASLCFLCANNLGDDLIASLFQSSRVLFGV